ncbi:MAG: hypothetical protein ACYDCH_09895 [Gaiellaceae bacterium]
MPLARPTLRQHNPLIVKMGRTSEYCANPSDLALVAPTLGL